jgi:hypothetical protein
MRRISVLFLAVLFGGTAICSAQQQSKWEVFGGFSLQRASGYPNLFNVNVNQTTPSDEFTGFNLKGGEAEVTYFPFAHVGFTGDFAMVSKSQSVVVPQDTQTVHELDYLFGPTFRYTFKGSPRLTVFAHQLFGVGHTSITFTPSNFDCSYTSSGSGSPTCQANPFTTVSGGGVDFRVASHISIRPAQFDYWEQQVSEQTLLGAGSVNDSSKFGISGFRYSAGAVVNF